MKLSIIIPVYNAEKYLNTLMQSILKSQKDFEVICVNDGSTDNSLSILQSYQDDRVTVYSKKNEGVFKTWQYGLTKAKGDYVTIFDADDYIDSEYIDVIYDFINNIGGDMMYTPYFIETENGDKYVSKLPFQDGIYSDENLNKLRKLLISGKVPYSKTTKIIKKSILEEQVRNTYQGVLKDFEDWLTIIPVFNNIKNLYVSNVAYYHYVQHLNSVSKTTTSYEDNYDALIIVCKFLMENKYSNLSTDDILSIYFYGSKSIIYRSIKIKEFHLAKRILKSEDFHNFIRLSNLSDLEKILLYIGNPRLIFVGYCIRDINSKIKRSIKRLNKTR